MLSLVEQEKSFITSGSYLYHIYSNSWSLSTVMAQLVGSESMGSYSGIMILNPVQPYTFAEFFFSIPLNQVCMFDLILYVPSTIFQL